MKTFKQKLLYELLQTEVISDVCRKKPWDISERAPEWVLDRLLQSLDERLGRSRSLFNSADIGGGESVQQGDLSFLDNVNNTLVQHPDLTDLVVTAMDTSSQM